MSWWSKKYDYTDKEARYFTVLCNYSELESVLCTTDRDKIDNYLDILEELELIKICEETKGGYDLMLHVFEVDAKIRVVLDDEKNIVPSDLTVIESNITDESDWIFPYRTIPLNLYIYIR